VPSDGSTSSGTSSGSATDTSSIAAIIDLGPGAGHDGGRIVFEGTPADLIADGSTLTGQHLKEYVGA
jgi:excinuclease UvrABC ATPase subunit